MRYLRERAKAEELRSLYFSYLSGATGMTLVDLRKNVRWEDDLAQCQHLLVGREVVEALIELHRGERGGPADPVDQGDVIERPTQPLAALAGAEWGRQLVDEAVQIARVGDRSRYFDQLVVSEQEHDYRSTAGEPASLIGKSS